MSYNHYRKFIRQPGYLALAGMAFGYPSCCIEHFIQQESANPFSDNLFPEVEGMWFDGTGYIACPTCRQLPKEEIISSINQRRFIKTPFPEGNGLGIDVFKAMKYFCKNGVPYYYIRLRKEFAKLKLKIAMKHTYHHVQSQMFKDERQGYSTRILEVLHKKRRWLAEYGIDRKNGWKFVSTKTCGTPYNFVILLGRNRGHYIWACSPASNVEDKVSNSLAKGYITPDGHYVPETIPSAVTLAAQLYDTGWDGVEYDYPTINEELSRLRFRTSDLNYDFQVKLSGQYDLNGGPDIVRETVRRIFNQDYLFWDENDLLGPENPPFEVNFYHPKYGWGDLLKFRQLSIENDQLTMEGKIEHFFEVAEVGRGETIKDFTQRNVIDVDALVDDLNKINANLDILGESNLQIYFLPSSPAPRCPMFAPDNIGRAIEIQPLGDFTMENIKYNQHLQSINHNPKSKE